MKKGTAESTQFWNDSKNINSLVSANKFMQHNAYGIH